MYDIRPLSIYLSIYLSSLLCNPDISITHCIAFIAYNSIIFVHYIFCSSHFWILHVLNLFTICYQVFQLVNQLNQLQLLPAYCTFCLCCVSGFIQILANAWYLCIVCAVCDLRQVMYWSWSPHVSIFGWIVELWCQCHLWFIYLFMNHLFIYYFCVILQLVWCSMLNVNSIFVQFLTECPVDLSMFLVVW